jgi:hypothetical protein
MTSIKEVDEESKHYIETSVLQTEGEKDNINFTNYDMEGNSE